MKKNIFCIINDFNKTIYLTIFSLYFLISIEPILPCNVPVFRYALERWTADPYRIMVFHKGQMSVDNAELLKELKYLSFQGDSTLNLVTQYTDINITGENTLNGLDENLTYPLMMLFYPEETGIPYPLWLGELTKSNLDLLKVSPARKKIANLLMSGETAVFLFLESGNSELDQNYYNILKQEIEILSTKLKIPSTGTDIEGNPIEVDDFTNVDLNFVIKKISRKDPTEQIFINMLLGTESDLSDYQVPLVFPVFGQGRSLYALVGSGINETTIEKACRSLVAWCSCEIKALHQGVDLLFLAEWSSRVGESWIRDEELPPLTGLSEFIESSDKTEEIVENADENELVNLTVISNENPDERKEVELDSIVQTSAESEIQESFSISKNIGLLLLILICVIIVLSYMIKNRKSG